MTKRILPLACLALLLLGGAALAQAQPTAGEELNMFQIYVLRGGYFNFLIIALSIVTIALIIEHIVTLNRDKLAPPQVIVELEQLIDEEQYEEALNLCEATPNYVTNVVGAALARVGEGMDPMVNSMESAIDEQNLKLAQKISWLSLCGNLGPMMGLYGTVVGMVDAFTQIATATSTPSPAQLASGIYTALVTTVWGLLVAMPALSAFFIFKNKIQKVCFELAAVAAELVERTKPAMQPQAKK
jgi:biopolymer transport protein ExbB